MGNLLRKVRTYTTSLGLAGILAFGSGCETASDTNLAGNVATGFSVLSSTPAEALFWGLLGETAKGEAQIQGQKEAAEYNARLVAENNAKQWAQRETDEEAKRSTIGAGNVYIQEHKQLGRVHINEKANAAYGKGFYIDQRENPGVAFMAACKGANDFDGDGTAFFPDEWIGIDDTFDKDGAFCIRMGLAYLTGSSKFIVVKHPKKEIVAKEEFNIIGTGFEHVFAPNYFKPGFYRVDFYTDKNSDKSIGFINFYIKEKNKPANNGD